MVGTGEGFRGVDRRVRFARGGDGTRYVQPDRDDVRCGVFRDRRLGSAEQVPDWALGEREVNERQQRVHWVFSHLADVLVLVLLVGFIVYSIYAWGPM